MKTNEIKTAKRTNYWPLLHTVGLDYGRNVTLDQDHMLDYCGLKFRTAKELYEYMTNPNAKSRIN
jgi:hypothetical protein